MDLRCKHKKHGEIVDDNRIEVKCNSRYCGAGQGVIVLHVFDARTGELLDTHTYKDARSSHVEHHSVRSA